MRTYNACMLNIVKSLFREFLLFIVIAVFIIIPFRIFVAQPFVVQGASMEQTFHNGEYLVVDQLTYRFNEPKRGDVITFRPPQDPSVFFVKRIIGLPGETIEIRDGVVTIIKDGEEPFSLVEPYAEEDIKGLPVIRKTLKDEEYFVLGDNRSQSSDSRIWGVLPEKNIMGRVFVRLLPFQKAGFFPGELK